MYFWWRSMELGGREHNEQGFVRANDVCARYYYSRPIYMLEHSAEGGKWITESIGFIKVLYHPRKAYAWLRSGECRGGERILLL